MTSTLRLFYIVLRSITIFEYRNTFCSAFSLLPPLVVFHVTCIHLIHISWDSNPVISNQQVTFARFVRKVQKRCNYGINVLKKKVPTMVFYVLHNDGNSRERTFFSCKNYVSTTRCTTTLQISKRIKRNSLKVCAPQSTTFRFEHDINTIITTTETKYKIPRLNIARRKPRFRPESNPVVRLGYGQIANSFKKSKHANNI